MAWTAPATWNNLEVVTNTKMNTHVRDNLRELWYEKAYVEFTADVSTSTHTEAAPLDIVSAGALTYVAAPILIEFYSPWWVGTDDAISFWDASTDLGRCAYAGPAALYNGPVHVVRRLTPTAASHTYKAVLWQNGGTTTTVVAGPGGVGQEMPGFIRVMQRGA